MLLVSSHLKYRIIELNLLILSIPNVCTVSKIRSKTVNLILNQQFKHINIVMPGCFYRASTLRIIMDSR